MAFSCLVSVCVLAVVFCGSMSSASIPIFEENGFNVNGSNVCKALISKTINVTVQVIAVRNEPYEVSCNWLFPEKKCIFYRYVFEKVKKVVPHLRHGYSLGCCHGWKKINQSDTECLKPICVHGCQHGKCVAADTCDCNPGWRGYTCGIDINECNNKNGGCQQECHNIAGSHVCGCRRGYIPITNDTTKCADINECKASKPRCICANSDPQCNATCVNTIGNFRCVCPKGYRLNGLSTCIDEDECLSSNNGCPHKCVNTPGSYKCTCFKGFKFEKKNGVCVDLNECKENNGGCEHTCLNTYGSYRCRCKRGYLPTVDRKKCRVFKLIIP